MLHHLYFVLKEIAVVYCRRKTMLGKRYTSNEDRRLPLAQTCKNGVGITFERTLITLNLSYRKTSIVLAVRPHIPSSIN